MAKRPDKADPIDSSYITEVRWWEDAGTSFLEVKFTSGASYLYTNVPYDVYKALLNAGPRGSSGSKGKFFAAHIKWSYRYEKL